MQRKLSWLSLPIPFAFPWKRHLFQTLNCIKSFSVSLPPSSFSLLPLSLLLGISRGLGSVEAQHFLLVSICGHPSCLLPKSGATWSWALQPTVAWSPGDRAVLGFFCSPAGFPWWSLWARWLWTALPEPSPRRELEKVSNIPQGLGTWHL